MAKINVLDNNTIDKIAAGEVVERPASVVKELVENAMDAGANAITVEIKEGGIEFIRVTDNGSGIEKEQVRNAFMRHATSKISNVSDLMRLHSMGFRGEALSSIAAVSKVEIITKTSDEITGIRCCLDGSSETEFEEIGAPEGTTFIVRNLFFNTPVRRKFLKTAMTEGSYITDLLEHMALSRPEISFKYMINGQTKFYTNGDGDLRAIIYRIFGRDVANQMMEFNIVDEDIVLEGFLGKPILNRANRNFENYFVNNRYIKSKVISKAIEEGYRSYLMQHKYPFCVLHITVPPESVDVNVHPTKMEVRFSNQNGIYKLISENISDFLSQQEMIPDATLVNDKKDAKKNTKQTAPEPFETERKNVLKESAVYGDEKNSENKTISSYDVKISDDRKSSFERLSPISNVNADDRIIKGLPHKTATDFFTDNRIQSSTDSPLEPKKESISSEMARQVKILGSKSEKESEIKNNIIKAKDQIIVEKPEQLNFFDEKLLSKSAKQEYRIIGQVFDTYWMIEYRDKMLIIDQHAAHEKVKYEQILKKVENKEVYTQVLTPPVVISVTPKESDLIQNYIKYYEELGFVIEDFGMNAYAIRGVPYDLFGYNIKDLFEEILTQMAENPVKGVPQIIKEKIASMACKAAVKGNNSLTYEEMDTLIEQLLELDNPYNCPHGRPTIISMSKYEIEKKFKRIV